jgi:hypothetical protein
MILSWLLKDNFLYQEIFKLFLSLLGNLFLAWLIQIVITKRDQKNQDLEHKRHQINEFRDELVQIFNEYYKVRKRYTTVRDTFVGDSTRNPYIQDQNEKINEVFDNLLITCIGLEARYSILIDRLSTTFPSFWKDSLEYLMESEVIPNHVPPLYLQVIKHKIEQGQTITLGSSFDIIRHQIEREEDINHSIKNSLKGAFHVVLAAFDGYEKQISSPKAAVLKFPLTGVLSRQAQKASKKRQAQANRTP